MLLFYDCFFKEENGTFFKEGVGHFVGKIYVQIVFSNVCSVSEIIKITHQKELDNFIQLQ